jgi:hypothetical protein
MTGAELAARWATVERTVEEHAVFPPGPLSVLGASGWDRVAAGNVVSIRTPSGAVAGIGLLACDRPACWLSLTDDHPREQVKGLTEIRLRGEWASPKLLYQHLDLPWPMQDRHWAIASTTNTTLATLSDVWERAWRTDANGLAAARAKTDPAAYDAALAVPVNEGDWMVLPVGTDQTLGIYQVRVDFGGAVPEGAAEGYAASTLTELFEKTARNAGDMRRRYGPGCAPQPGGDGRPLPCYGSP